MINGDGDKSGHEFGSRHYVDQNSEQTLRRMLKGDIKGS